MRRLASLSALLLVIACASTTTPSQPKTAGAVDMKEPRRMVGTESGVRVDAEIYGENLVQGASIAVRYDITNGRTTPILVADIVPETTYDPDTRTLTVSIGAEIPGEQLLPRLISIASGARRSFTAGAHVTVQAPLNPTLTPRPNALQLRINFLGDASPFTQLIDIPERAVHDPRLAAELFPKWVERNEVVITNALPMRWVASRDLGAEDSNGAAVGRRRRGN
jgi:hypothetical protein